MKLLSTLLLITGIWMIPCQGFISSIYSLLFGAQPLKAEYQELTKDALRKMNDPHAESVVIKKMNKLAALMGFSSFTAYNIWFDEEYLDQLTPEDRMFQCYHEAGHYTYGHHQTLLKKIALLAALVGTGAYGLQRVMHSYELYYANMINTLGLLAALGGIGCIIVPNIVRQQEEDADRIAAAYLKVYGHSNVIDERINSLKDENPGFWWPRPSEQVNYLKNT